MKNFIQDGDVITVASMPYVRTSGQGVLVGTSLFGVCCADYASGAEGEIRVTGVFDITKEATVDTYAVGDKVFWDNTNKRCTPTATANCRVGVCVKAAAATDTVVRVRLGSGGVIAV